MAFSATKTYNNNKENITVTTSSPISFPNPNSKIMPSRMWIDYFNKLMRINIAPRNPNSDKNDYSTYDMDSKVCVYLTFYRAKELFDMIEKMKSDDSIFNVCINTTSAMFKVSNGKEYGSDNYVFAICTDKDGSVLEMQYETQSDRYKEPYNFADGKYEEFVSSTLELDTFQMCLMEYYKASSYAIAASIADSESYRRHRQTELIKSIAGKVGVKVGGSKQYGNSTFLSRTTMAASPSINNDNNLNGVVPAGYDETDFSDIANAM